MTDLEKYLQENAKQLNRLNGLLARTPEQEYRYGGDFTGTREKFSSRVVASRPLNVPNTATAIDKMIITSPINHIAWRFHYEQFSEGTDIALLTASRFRIELSNNANQWKDGEHLDLVATIAPIFNRVMNVATGLFKVNGQISVDYTFPTRHKFFRVTLLNPFSSATKTARTLAQAFQGPIDNNQPTFEFFGE